MNRLLLEHKKSYDNIYVVFYKNDHDALMSVFYLIDTSFSKHVDIFFRYRLPLEDKRGLSLGELIRRFCIMLLY